MFEHPPKLQGKIRHTKTDLLLVTKFSKVTLRHQWTVTKHTVFGKINSLLLINPHAITYAMVEVFCPYRLG